MTCMSFAVLSQGSLYSGGAQGERESADDLQTSCALFIWGLFPPSLWPEKLAPLMTFSFPQNNHPVTQEGNGSLLVLLE